MNAESIAAALQLRRMGRGWRGPCPLHGGSSFTLNGRDGRLVWTCWSGCDRGAVLAELRLRGLWPERERREFTPEERRQYAKARAEAEAMAILAAAWLSERLGELDAEKVAAVDLQAGIWDVAALEAAAREHHSLSTSNAAGVLQAWQRARQVNPHGARQLERVGLTWRRACELAAHAVVKSLASGNSPLKGGTRNVA